MRAGFSQTDITPALGAPILGWLDGVIAREVADPLFAKVAILEQDTSRLAFLQLDTLCVRWSTTQAMRVAIAERFDFPGERVMVSATHNHAGPAVARVGDVQRDDAYLEDLVEKAVEAFGEALDQMCEARIGMGHVNVPGLSHNRRVVLRNGTVRTHGTLDDPEALRIEGPTDPELAVLVVRHPAGDVIGALVNFACHATHHGAHGILSAGYPGAIARELRSCGCPTTLFLNGAAGNLHTADPADSGRDPGAEHVGALLGKAAWRLIQEIEGRPHAILDSRRRIVALPFRQATKEAIAGKAIGAQRFGGAGVYERDMASVLERISKRPSQPAEVQVHRLGECYVAAVPCELFAELGFAVKERSHPRHTLIAGWTNGMVGYVPTREALQRGGYETTFADSSRLGPEAGDLLVDAIVAVVREMEVEPPV